MYDYASFDSSTQLPPATLKTGGEPVSRRAKTPLFLTDNQTSTYIYSNNILLFLIITKRQPEKNFIMCKNNRHFMHEIMLSRFFPGTPMDKMQGCQN